MTNLKQTLAEFEKRDFILQFYPRSVIQKENSVMNIPEIDTGTLTPESKNKIKSFLTLAIKDALEGVSKIELAPDDETLKKIDATDSKAEAFGFGQAFVAEKLRRNITNFLEG